MEEKIAMGNSFGNSYKKRSKKDYDKNFEEDEKLEDKSFKQKPLNISPYSINYVKKTKRR